MKSIMDPSRRCLPPYRASFITLAVWLSLPLVVRGDNPQDGQSNENDKHKYTNALIDSTSPYLLQHAHNPVNWMPWGPEALAKAKSENKPIFVSIGYSTCYWCHVMERESFENEEVAEVLNKHYIAVKVDREERPDIDEQFMLATQLLTGRGGWPNSVWLTTDGRPWMAGTYFPRDAFIDALEKLARVWEAQPENVEKQANSLSAAIRSAAEVPARASSQNGSPLPLERCLTELQEIYDAEHGGFGSQPKFPPHGTLRLLAHLSAEGSQGAREMMIRTLDAMWSGGIHDHVGGGFHRYSTDKQWLLPHFEKMLYDNAQLMRAYTEAYQATRFDRYRRAVADIFSWVQREMTHPQGGFYSAIDSESEGGEEGRYYTWSIQELERALGAADAAWLAQEYNAKPEGNFTEEATGERPGTNILYLNLDDLAPSDKEQVVARRNGLLDTLRAVRTMRERPHLDDKILTAWNGLMISALARAGAVLEEPEFTRAAARAADFILEELQHEGRLLRSWRKEQAQLPGYLNDYAFFIEGLWELHRTTREARWLNEAQRLARDMLRLFEDEQQGGFFFTAPDHEELLLRSKNLFGGGNLPVGNGVAAQVLLHLYREVSEDEFLRAGQSTLRCFAGLLSESPRQVEHLVLADAQYRQWQSRQQNGQQDSKVLPDAKFRDEAVEVELFLSKRKVSEGDTIRVTLEASIRPGFHLYSPSNKDWPITSTAMELPSSKHFEFGPVEYPQGQMKKDAILERELEVYEGRLRIEAPLQVMEETPDGQHELVFLFHFQACDANRCLEPKQAGLKAKLHVESP